MIISSFWLFSFQNGRSNAVRDALVASDTEVTVVGVLPAASGGLVPSSRLQSRYGAQFFQPAPARFTESSVGPQCVELSTPA